MNKPLLMMILSSLVGVCCMITTTTASTATTSTTKNENNQQHRKQQIRQPDTETRIVGGEQSAIKQFPYFVDIRRVTCGGSLIAPQIVLTAAHCDFGLNLVGQQVIVGAYEDNVGNNAGSNNEYDSITVEVVDEVPHPDYDPSTESNDLLLLLLAVPIYIEEPTVTISTDDDYYAPLKNTPMTAVGLGLLTQGGSIRPDFVRHVVVPVVDPDLCGQLYQMGGSYNFDGHTMFCAGDYVNGGIDTCQGDSGGPIVDASNPTQHILHGVTSWGLGCAQVGFPGIYAKTGSSIDWIRSVVCSQEGWNVYADFCDPTDQGSGSPTTAPTQGCPNGEFLVDWRFHTDDFGAETAWDLSDTHGNEIQSVKYGQYGNDEQNRVQICLHCDAPLQNQVYRLSLFDQQLDGMCCGGNPSYNLIVDGDVLADVKVGDKDIDYGGGIYWEFTGNASCPTPSPTPNPTLAPTRGPTSSPTTDPSPAPTEPPTQPPTTPPSVPPTPEPTPGPSPQTLPAGPSTDVLSQGPASGDAPSPSPVSSIIATETSALADSASSGATVRYGTIGGKALLALVVLMMAYWQL